MRIISLAVILFIGLVSSHGQEKVHSSVGVIAEKLQSLQQRAQQLEVQINDLDELLHHLEQSKNQNNNLNQVKRPVLMLRERMANELRVEDPYFYDGTYLPEVETSFFHKIGSSFKTAGKDVLYGAEKAAPYAIPAIEIAGALGGISVEDPFYPTVQRHNRQPLKPQSGQPAHPKKHHKSFLSRVGGFAKKVLPYVPDVIKIAKAVTDDEILVQESSDYYSSPLDYPYTYFY
ncbi:UNKNOWN [Stylonychia lemnae]|uniref:Uncharacterized protein n=1 Tax=Stylonychia lemnae TaxID=5949 RepID=A0A078A7H4_STYLE|nr:UNKNOWN [Stylonychia lemnae]|eukprot:CDW76741.1 UNKNOWN [Stylonychia lemnae]